MKKLAGFIAAGLFVFAAFPTAALASYGEYNFQPVDYCVVVAAWDGYVNFRSGPGLAYGIICPIYNGEILYVSNTADNYQDGLWNGQINYYGDYGWISLSEVSFIENSYENADYNWGYEDNWGYYSGRHAWNVGYANGTYFYFDVTWDDDGYWADRTWFGLGEYSMGMSHIPDPEYYVLPWADGIW